VCLRCVSVQAAVKTTEWGSCPDGVGLKTSTATKRRSTFSRYGAKSGGGREGTLFRGAAIQGEKKTAEPIYLPSLMIISSFLWRLAGQKAMGTITLFGRKKLMTMADDSGRSGFSSGRCRKQFAIINHWVYNCSSDALCRFQQIDIIQNCYVKYERHREAVRRRQ